MSESKRFDPLDWFVSACFTALAGAVALVVAIHLIRTVWIWIVIGLGVALFVGVLVRLFVWWQRRQSW